MSDTLTVRQAAELLGIRPRSVRAAIERGRLAATLQEHGFLPDGYYVIERAELERYQAEHAGKAGRPATS